MPRLTFSLGIWLPRHQPLFWTMIHERKFLNRYYIFLFQSYDQWLWNVSASVLKSPKCQSLHSPNLYMTWCIIISIGITKNIRRPAPMNLYMEGYILVPFALMQFYFFLRVHVFFTWLLCSLTNLVIFVCSKF